MFLHGLRVSILLVDFQPILPFLLLNGRTMMVSVSNDFPKDYAVRLRWRCGRNASHLDHTLLGTPIPSVLTGCAPQNCPICGGIVYVEAPPPSLVIADKDTGSRSFLRGLFGKDEKVAHKKG